MQKQCAQKDTLRERERGGENETHKHKSQVHSKSESSLPHYFWVAGFKTMFIGLIFPSAPFQILSNNQEEGKKKAQCPDNVKHEAQP